MRSDGPVPDYVFYGPLPLCSRLSPVSLDLQGSYQETFSLPRDVWMALQRMECLLCWNNAFAVESYPGGFSKAAIPPFSDHPTHSTICLTHSKVTFCPLLPPFLWPTHATLCDPAASAASPDPGEVSHVRFAGQFLGFALQPSLNA